MWYLANFYPVTTLAILFQVRFNANREQKAKLGKHNGESEEVRSKKTLRNKMKAEAECNIPVVKELSKTLLESETRTNVSASNKRRKVDQLNQTFALFESSSDSFFREDIHNDNSSCKKSANLILEETNVNSVDRDLRSKVVMKTQGKRKSPEKQAKQQKSGKGSSKQKITCQATAAKCSTSFLLPQSPIALRRSTRKRYPRGCSVKVLNSTV